MERIETAPWQIQNFFFSSRRRHTRYIGDWSSDVCSSDLRKPGGACRRRAGPRGRSEPRPDPARTEERRVGKECKSRGLPDAVRKNDYGHDASMGESGGGLMFSVSVV